ncbi:MAG: histidine decarboxylase [Dehalococcoidia bacterium]|nr:histidine decarboxylase [Dehalococcoidia bacterium]MYA54496.1 histidine decarboxylase [Dehalococcoidia bacterium]
MSGENAPQGMGAPRPETRARLDALQQALEETSRRQAGYPANLAYDYSALTPFLQYSLNNIGDPFHESNYAINSRAFEREVIAAFANLMHLPAEAAWGYVTSGGTEGNMYGLYLARKLHPDGIVFFSQDTHYSVLKNLSVLNMRNIMIKSQENGELDYDDLFETVRIHRDTPVIVMANIGTTMKGAIDDLGRVRAILEDLAIASHYIHADAALSGMILPFVDDPQPYGFDAGIDSVSLSGHKVIGAPLPCGVVLTKREYVNAVARSVEYLGTLDTTVPGSRSGFTPLILWYALEHYGLDGLRRLVGDMLDMAAYAVERFNENGIPAWRNHNSVTVVFPRPSEEVVRRWQLAPLGDIAHVITMPHITRETVDEIVDACATDAGSTRT